MASERTGVKRKIAIQLRPIAVHSRFHVGGLDIIESDAFNDNVQPIFDVADEPGEFGFPVYGGSAG